MSYERPTFVLNPSTGLPPQAMYGHPHPPHQSPIMLAYAPHPMMMPPPLAPPPPHHLAHPHPHPHPHHPSALSPHMMSTYTIPAPPFQQVPPPQTQNQPKRSGFCKFFNAGKGFGFIQDDNPGELPTMDGDPGTDIFVHYSCITRCDAGFKSLLDGEKVEYVLGRSNKGLAALDITGPGGAPVKGASSNPSSSAKSPSVIKSQQQQQQQYMPAQQVHQTFPQSIPSPFLSCPIGPPQSNNLTVTRPTRSISPSLESSGLSQQVSTWIPNSTTPNRSPQTNVSPTFGINLGAVGTKSMRREATETSFLGVNSLTTKMLRVSSTPIPSGLGIGVVWESSNHNHPRSRNHSPIPTTTIWSPPGGRRTSLQKDSNMHFPTRRSGEIDRTQSNWRDSPKLSSSTSGLISPNLNIEQSPILPQNLLSDENLKVS